MDCESLLTTLHGLHRSILRYGNSRLLENGCPIEYQQFRMLKVISETQSRNAVSVVDLSVIMKMDRTTMSHNSNKLLSLGLVNKVKTPGGNKTIILISDEGRRVLNEHMDAYTHIKSIILSGIREEFGQELKRIERNLL